MADVQFVHSIYLCNGANITVGKAMASVEYHASFADLYGSLLQLGQLFAGFCLGCGVGIGSGMQLNRLGASVDSCGDLRLIGVEKQADGDARILQSPNGVGNRLEMARNVEAPFGGDFLAALGNESRLRGSGVTGNLEHFVGGCQFQVGWHRHRFDQNPHIAILDMATVFAEVKRNAIGPAEFR